MTELLTGELTTMGDRIRDRFRAQKRVLSFREYLELFEAHPWRHSRDASRYLRDCFDHFGSYDVSRPSGKVRRFRLFDLDFGGSKRADGRSDHLVGHESVQNAVYRILSNFVREGRSNRLILLHGPNGSAKSTFSACIMQGLQVYSNHDEGALYRFSWIFPRGTDGKGIGFSTTSDAPRQGETYAHLPEERIDVKLQSTLREHPLLLVPIQERGELVRRAYERTNVDEDPPDWVFHGELSQKNRQIFEALLTAYRGDLARVYAHVQVERYYFSRRYRVGAVTIGPQMAVDASERQITADRTLNSLPASLSALTLFEPYGELVDAAGGVVEYSDLLKRPLDAWKYLLLSIETGEVSLPLSNLALNSVLMASSNELHLAAFRQHPEFNSFRGRIQMVRVPYLLDYRQEQGIYDSQIVPQVRRHVAPHATFVAALWAVLTRLRRPQSERFEKTPLGRIAADLTPIEKAELYATGTIPKRLSDEDSKELRAGIKHVVAETEAVADYEGLTGVSPREVRTLILDGAQDPEFDCLAPTAVLDRIEAFGRRDDYDFLKMSPDRGYHDQSAFLKIVTDRWLNRVDDEVREAAGLVEESQYVELFSRYVTQVSYWVKKERVYNPVTGRLEDPDEELMSLTEEKLGAGDDAEKFRRNLISTIAAHAIDNPDLDSVDKAALFPRYIERLKEAYFLEHRKVLIDIVKAILALVTRNDQPDEEHREKAESALKVLKDRYGYQESSVRVALGELLRSRYIP